MIFTGITKDFSLLNETQYDTIGQFWDQMSTLYGLENLQGLGYKWTKDTISYAIGLKVGEIANCNFSIQLPDTNWIVTTGKTDELPEIYQKIYKSGPLKYEIETFNQDGTCTIKYYR